MESEPQIFHLMLAKSKRADLDFPQHVVLMPDESHACAEQKFRVSSGIRAADFSYDAGEKQEGRPGLSATCCADAGRE
jgi:hypothetical protein